jgi:meso-butanediol dehydrogenase/(S,S)-butanediol dehydrogenase/diacetyl reductase
MNTLLNIVVIVTGAGSGIGKATAKRFLNEGAKVVLSDLDESRLTRIVEGLDTNKYLTLKVDVSNEESVKVMVEKTVQTFGQIDVLVNNAGILIPGIITEIDIQSWHKLLATDLDSVFFCSRTCIPYLEQTKGCIINVSSVSGLGADAGIPAYNAAKGAVTNLTRAMAIDHAAAGIRVNSVCPTFIAQTAFGGGMEPPQSMIEKVLDRIPLGRVGEPEDVASAIYLLASEDARFITGVNLPVDGGLSASNGQPIHY